MISGKSAAAAEFDAHTAVARKTSGTGEDEIAETGESGHGILAAAAGHDQAGDLGQAAGDQGRDRVVSQSEAIANPGGDGDNILQRAAKFHASYITVGINAKTRITEFSLDGFRQFTVAGCDGDRGRIAAGYFLGEGWSTERGDAGRKASV